MTSWFSGAESALGLSQSKAVQVRHSDIYGLCVLPQLIEKSDVQRVQAMGILFEFSASLLVLTFDGMF